jgi:hypothetical protein
MNVISEYIGNDVTNLSECSGMFKESEMGELRLYLKRLLYQTEMDELATTLGQLKQDGCLLPILFRYDGVTFAAMVETINNVIVPEDIMIGWQLLKNTTARFPVWGWVMVGAALVVAAIGGKR